MADAAPTDKPAGKPVAVATPAPTPSVEAPKVDAKAAPTERKPAAAKKVAKKPAVKTTTKPAAKPAPRMKDRTMDTMKTTTDKTKDMMAQANERAKTAVEKGQKMMGEMNDFSKGNIEAIVESSKIAAKGIESMSQDAVAYAKASFEEATAAAKQMASVKSPTELMKLQSDYVRNAFDSMVSHTAKSTEAMLKLVGEVAQPISNRASLAAEKVKLAA